MVYTDVRVTFQTDAGKLTVTDQVLGVEVSDELDTLPSGQVRLPLHRTTTGGRKRYSELIRPGDLCRVELLAWNGKEGDWEVVLEGPVTSVAEVEAVGPESSATTTIGVESAAHYLATDQVAQWMWLGSVAGWQPVFSELLPSQTVGTPHTVAQNYLQKVAFHRSGLNIFGKGLADLIALEFDGLKAVAPLTLTLSMAEGTHLEIIRRFLDAPLHELYATTKGGKTTLIWRKAPYPFPDTGEWQALKLHRLEGDWAPVRSRQAAYRLEAVRNFFLLYPALSFVEEYPLMALGVAYQNQASIRRFGYRPMKIRTHLIHNEKPLPESTLVDFLEGLTKRLAAQWNRMHEMAAGVVEIALAPWIRPGERVRAKALWGSQELELHVRARHMVWDPREGGRMTLALERGLPPEVYRDPEWFMKGLAPVRISIDWKKPLEDKLRER